MARWVLGCNNCKSDFTHTEIAPSDFDPFVRTAPKPEFPAGGLSVNCPNCGEADVYQRHELTYRMD
jgi:hypothetical protein